MHTIDEKYIVMHFPNTIEWLEEESKKFKEKNCVFM